MVQDGAAGGFSNRQVYFVGDRAGTTLPAGVATYSVAGLNKFNGSNLLSGTFRANSAMAPCSWPERWRLSINVNANINSANASFAGTATANGSVAGTTQGQFFGANAATLAGIATQRQQPVRHRLRRQQELIATPLTGQGRDKPRSASPCFGPLHASPRIDHAPFHLPCRTAVGRHRGARPAGRSSTRA